jgi:glycosyltransferase involved in cell wall biosynthesis
MRTKRIAVFPGFLNAKMGGAVRSALLHAAMLAGHGAEADVFGLYSDKVEPDIDDIPLDGMRIYRYRAFRHQRFLTSPSLIEQFETLVSSFDVVHFNGHWNTINYRLAKICRKLLIPYIISSRGTLGLHCDVFRDASLGRLRPFDRDFTEGAVAIHMTSAQEVNQALVDAVWPTILTIPNSVELSRFYPCPDRDSVRAFLGISRNEEALLFYGRVVPDGWPIFAGCPTQAGRVAHICLPLANVGLLPTLAAVNYVLARRKPVPRVRPSVGLTRVPKYRLSYHTPP